MSAFQPKTIQKHSFHKTRNHIGENSERKTVSNKLMKQLPENKFCHAVNINFFLKPNMPLELEWCHQ